MNIPTAKGSFNPLFNIYSAFHPLSFVENYTKKYGDFYRFKLLNDRQIIVVSNSQAIEEIFTAAPDHFRSAEANKAFSFLLGDKSILLLDGKAHRNRRRLLMPPFHGESLQECSEEIIKITNVVCDLLKTDRPFAVRCYMQEITLRVILNVVFGIDRGTRYERLRELLVELLETFNTPLKSLAIVFPLLQKDWSKFSPWGRFLRLKAEIRELIHREIKQRRKTLAKGESHQDILSLLISAYEYIPFGGGKRRCIGSALALLEIKLVTATVLSRFQLALTSLRPIYPVSRGITLAPPASFEMVVQRCLGSGDKLFASAENLP